MAALKKTNVRFLLTYDLTDKRADSLDRRHPGWSVRQRSAKLLPANVVEVEENVFLARKVIEDSHPTDVSSFGNLIHGHLIVPALEEQSRGSVGDRPPGGEALSSSTIAGD
ncbi:hypothetical protein D9M69_687690 [compost metagenome]